MTTFPAARFTSTAIAATKGTSTSACRWVPGSGRDREQVLPVVEDIADRAHQVPGHGHHGQPGELMVVELVRILRQVHVGGVHREQDAAQ